MAKLNQIIAIEKGIKSRAQTEFTDLYKVSQKADLFNGFQKTYQSNADDGDQLPAERKHVQRTVTEILTEAQSTMSEIMDITARKDFTNCVAKADVVVDGVTVVKDAPVTYLLFLEKHLTDVRTLVGSLPVLEATEDWTFDEGAGISKSAEVKTHRTKKTQKPIVAYQATDKHPAQVIMVTEDVIEGYWTQIKQSGAIKKTDKNAIADRVELLLQAVKQSREAANSVDEVLPDAAVGKAIFSYLFG